MCESVLLVGTGVYFAFHLAWNLILLSFLLVCIGAISAVAGFYRTWRIQTRTKVLNNGLDEVFRRWYPRFRAKAA